MTHVLSRCPICETDKLITINAGISYCKKCCTTINNLHQTIEYENNYFLDGYRSQYGKTYLEDFDNIYSLSKKRFSSIIPLMKDRDLSKKALLDIGSAMGFFLKCGRDMGIGYVQGIEISQYAAQYASEKLKIDVIQSSFEEIPITRLYDIITAWYFVEHCKDPVRIFKKIYAGLAPGGIFAFSVPSVFGPLFSFDRERWIKTHPNDHRMDFSPKSIRLLMKKIGYKKIIVKPSGIHPERVISSENIWFPFFSRLYHFFSRMTAFSDTIEVYAVK